MKTEYSFDEELKRLRGLRLDVYAVDQGLMLNCLVGGLTGMMFYNEDGKVSVKDIVSTIERIHNQCKLVK